MNPERQSRPPGSPRTFRIVGAYIAAVLVALAVVVVVLLLWENGAAA